MTEVLAEIEAKQAMALAEGNIELFHKLEAQRKAAVTRANRREYR